MSIQFFTNDLPAARAYVANELSSHGYEDEAFIVRSDDFDLDAGAFVWNCVTRIAAKLMELWAPVSSARVPVHQFPTADPHSL